jgi:hypothetical protein
MMRCATCQATSFRQGHALLERACHQIGATLDIHRTAAELADLAVPELADRIAPPVPADRSCDRNTTVRSE